MSLYPFMSWNWEDSKKPNRCIFCGATESQKIKLMKVTPAMGGDISTSDHDMACEDIAACTIRIEVQLMDLGEEVE